MGEWRALSQVDATVHGDGYTRRYLVGLIFRHAGAEWFVVPLDFWGRPHLRALVGWLRTAIQNAGAEVAVTERVRAIMEWGVRDELEVAQLKAIDGNEADAARLLAAAKWRWVRLEHRTAARLAQAATERNAQDVDAWRTWLAIEAERGAGEGRLRALAAEVAARAPGDERAGAILLDLDALRREPARRAWVSWVVAGLWIAIVAIMAVWRAQDGRRAESLAREADEMLRAPYRDTQRAAEAGDAVAMLKLADLY